MRTIKPVDIQVLPIDKNKSIVYNEIFTKLIMALQYVKQETSSVIKMNIDFSGLYKYEEVSFAIACFLNVYCKHYRIASYRIPEYLYDPEVNSEVYFVNHEDPTIGYIERDVLIVPRWISTSDENRLVERLNPSVIIGL